MKITKLKMTKRIWPLITAISYFGEKYEATIIKIADLKKTVFLKTAIIENEWTTRLNKDILEGPTYLRPLIEFTELSSLMWYLNEPEKLLHKLDFDDKILTSFLVKQL